MLNNIVLRKAICFFRKVARKFRSFEESYLVNIYHSNGGPAARVPMWALDLVVLTVKLCTTCLVSCANVVFPPPLKSLQGETILITGAGHGIGRELALQFADLGATVVCWDNNAVSNSHTVREIKAKDGDVTGYTVDVTAREQVIAIAHAMQKRFTEVTMVVSNAGYLSAAPILHVCRDSVTKMIEVNLLAHFWIIQTFLPNMIERRHGHIVAINSTAGIIPFSEMTPYCAAKYGLRGLMESLSEELRLDTLSKNIKTTSVYLATVSTGMYQQPAHRFTGLYSETTPKEAAKSIIEGVQKNYRNISIPNFMLCLVDVNNLLPYRVRLIFTDFLNFGHRSWFWFC